MSGVYVGIDGSDHSRIALDWAMREAGYRHQPLTVIAVQEIPVTGWAGALALRADFEIRDKVREAAQDAVDKAVAELGEAGPPSVTVEAFAGVASARLVEASKDADLVVVGSRGVGGFTRLMIGSTSSQVSQHAHCPVAIIR